MGSKSVAVNANDDDEVANTAARHLDFSPLLEIVSPAPGFVLERALCSSYSAQTAVLAAMLMAMIRQGTFDGHGSRNALAHALHRLKGKVHFLVQHGRFTGPRARNPIVHLLDRFVVQVPYDERLASWHPKVCVLHYVKKLSDGGQESAWRLWLGSRNFTRDDSWDMAFTLASEPVGGQGTSLPDIAQVAARLAATAGVSTAWQADLKALARVKWDVPKGLCVEEVKLFVEGDKLRTLPPVPANTKRVIAVSPFLDAWALEALVERLGPKVRPVLISTDICLEATARLARTRLAKYDLLSLGISGQDILEEDPEAEQTAEEDPQPRGLHAKFIWTEGPGRGELRVGSTNLTQRGWKNNAEIMATISVALPATGAAAQLQQGLFAFRDQCMSRTLDQLGLQPDADEENQKEFEELRKRVVHLLKATQTLSDDGSVRVCSAIAPPLPPGASLHVGRVGDVRETWPAGATEVILSRAPLYENGNFLHLELKLGEHRCAWLQDAPFEPPLSEEQRDRPLLQAYLGLQGLLDWLNDTLTPGGNSGGDRVRWDKQGQASSQIAKGPVLGIESVLGSWLRDRPALLEARSIVQMAMKCQPVTQAEREARRRLDAFLASWPAIEEELLQGLDK